MQQIIIVTAMIWNLIYFLYRAKTINITMFLSRPLVLFSDGPSWQSVWKANWEGQHTGVGEQIGVIWRACTYGEETENGMSKAFILKDKDIKRIQGVFAGGGNRGREFDGYSWEAAVGSWQWSRVDKIWGRQLDLQGMDNRSKCEEITGSFFCFFFLDVVLVLLLNKDCNGEKQ